MSHSTTSGGGRTTRAARAKRRAFRRRCLRPVRRVAAMSITGPRGSGRMRRVRRKSSGKVQAADFGAGRRRSRRQPIASKSIVLQPFGVADGHDGVEFAGLSSHVAAARRLLAERLGQAAAAGCRPRLGLRGLSRPAWPSWRRTGWRPGRARTARRRRRTGRSGHGDGSWWRARLARNSPRSPSATRVSASCAASMSAGPTGRPARRRRRANSMTLAAMAPFSAVIARHRLVARQSRGARRETAARPSDCFVASAPRNDGSRGKSQDRFVEVAPGWIVGPDQGELSAPATRP